MIARCPICDFPVNLMQTKCYKDKDGEWFVMCPHGHSFDPFKARAEQRARELPWLGKHLREAL